MTQHNDTSRTGANLSETTLKVSNVNVNTFGQLFSRTVDGQVYAQPLYMPNVAIPSKGTHNVVYVVTEHDSVYAFDADDLTQSSPLWQVSMGTAEPAVDSQCDNLTPEIGITSTPVIDPVSKTLYLVAKTKSGGNWFDTIHALDITTGADKLTPAVIQGSVAGTGEGGSTIMFNSVRQYNRPGLLLINGVLYIAYASACDIGPYHGWVFGYSVSPTIHQVGIYADSPNGSWDGVWQSGQGLVADAGNNVYLTTGNGTFDATPTPSDFGEAFLKLSTASGLSVGDWFVPSNYANLNANDLDVSSGGPLGIPGTTLIVGGGKQGMLYVLDTTNMGHYHSAGDTVVQEWQAVGSRIYGAPIFWNNTGTPTLFVWGSQDSMKAYRFTSGTFNTSPTATTSLATPTGLSSVGALSVSSNGSTAGTGIVWASVPWSGDPDTGVKAGALHAYDASNIATELWNSRQNAARDDYGNYSKFCPPTVANGKVYQATFSNQLCVYGLLPTVTAATPAFSPPGGTYASSQSVTISDTTPGASIYYTTDGTTPTLSSTKYSGAILVSTTKTVKAIAAASGDKISTVASATYTIGGTTTLSPVADAFIQSGSSVNTNFGTYPSLISKKVTNDSTSNLNRCGYLKFDLTGVTTAPTTATLNLVVNSGSNPATSTENVQLYSVSNTAWTETGITWNNAPGLNTTNFTSTGTLLTTKGVPLTPGTASFDVTAFVQANIGKIVTFQLMDATNQSLYLVFNSRESSTGKPTLVLH